MNCPAPGLARPTRSFPGHPSSVIDAISGACHAAAVDGATHLDAAGSQRSSASPSAGYSPRGASNEIPGQTCSDAARPRSGSGEVLVTSLITHQAVTPLRRFRAGGELMAPRARRRDQMIPCAQRAAKTWACVKKVSRAFHGQQDAHRRITPGRNPGGGAAR